jgi:PAS domain S-box-containing protein
MWQLYRPQTNRQRPAPHCVYTQRSDFACSHVRPARRAASLLSPRVLLHLACTALVCLAAPAVLSSQPAAEAKRVVVLYWYNKDYPVNVIFDQSFRDALRSKGGDVEYYPEYLESNRFPGPIKARALRDYLRRKYADVPIDVVVASDYVPREFLRENRDDLFAGVPLVFVGGDVLPDNVLKSGPGITGIVLYDALKKNLDMALRLHPKTEHVFIVSGTLEHDGRYEWQARRQLRGYKSRAKINYLTDVPPAELIVRMKQLPKGSIVLYIWQQARTGQGGLFESAEILALFSQTAQVPVYGMNARLVGHGIVGGQVFSVERLASRAAEIAVQITNGTRAQDIPLESGATVPTFDRQQLERWGISKDRLPEGSVLMSMTPSFWSLYRWRVMGVAFLCIAQALLIGALLAQRARGARTEELLREQTAELHLLTEAIPQHVWTSRPDGSRDYDNRRWLEYTGLIATGGMMWREIIHPDDRERALRVYDAALRAEKDFEVEARLRAADGSYRWFLSRSIPLRDSAGRVIRWYGTNTDIEDRKQVEEVLRINEEALRRSHAQTRDLAGRLITAQDEERNHIARELHDDLNQQVAALAINLSQLKRELPDDADSVHQQVAKLQEGVDRLSSQIRDLSHQLHSSVLQHVGLAVALESHCREFASREGVALALDFQTPGSIPPHIAHCLFRVAQESLRNVAQHSGAQHAEVVLAETDGFIELRIKDQGVGCDVSRLQERRGLGLISIEERVRLLRGTFTLHTAPGAGTETRVRIPLNGAGAEHVAESDLEMEVAVAEM